MQPMKATFSDCGRFRYLLSEVWDSDLPMLTWCMLNPSVAGRVVDGRRIADPTWRRARGFSERLGYGGQVLCNAYAYIATDPRILKRDGYPIGDLNDSYIRQACEMGDGKVICGWGAPARGQVRPGKVLALLRAWGYTPMALGLTRDGLPRHPLMLSYATELVPL